MPDGKSLTSRAPTAVALALAASLSVCGGGGGRGPLDVAGLNYPNAQDYPIHGIDVSKFQGDIDWNAVANSGVKFAWIKATEGGDRLDQHFEANWTGAKAAGVPHGAYHFVYWCRPPMEEMERHYGKRPVIYTTVDFYQAILSDGAFMDYPIWVRSTKYRPAVKYGLRPWHFWQYQSDGRVAGIQAHVDRDAFYGTKEQWDAFLRDEESGARRPSVQQAVAQQPPGTQTVAAQAEAPEPREQQSAPQQPVQQLGVQQADAEQPAVQQSAEQQ